MVIYNLESLGNCYSSLITISKSNGFYVISNSSIANKDKLFDKCVRLLPYRLIYNILNEYIF